MKWMIAGAAALLCMAAPSVAQNAGEGATAIPAVDAEWTEWLPSPGEIEMPRLEFKETAEDIKNYDKYFYFYRPETTFAEALADLRECDRYARGLYGGDYYPDPSTYAMYGLGGAIGGVIGGAIASAIYGSAEQRRKRRANMRRCMFFKDYGRYGLSKDLWHEFHYEGSKDRVPERKRQEALVRQAKVASESRPSAKELGL